MGCVYAVALAGLWMPVKLPAHGEHHFSAASCPLGSGGISQLPPGSVGGDPVLLCVFDSKDCFDIYSRSRNEIQIYKVCLNTYRRSSSLLRKALVMSRREK